MSMNYDPSTPWGKWLPGKHTVYFVMWLTSSHTLQSSPLSFVTVKRVYTFRKTKKSFLHYKPPLCYFLYLQQRTKVRRHFVLVGIKKMKTLDIPRGGRAKKCTLTGRALLPPVPTLLEHVVSFPTSPGGREGSNDQVFWSSFTFARREKLEIGTMALARPSYSCFLVISKPSVSY